MPDASPRTSYSLQFEDDGVGLAKRMEFEAASASVALEIAERECDGRWALLACDGQPVCRVGHNGGTWTIAPALPPTCREETQSLIKSR
ncbi:hypothetical protein OVY29_03400 [Sphingopyxis sp. SE2]|jgi:hypothetical protein|uniref:hypothetical protein n=1 Tax=unclassified Sphingopyxis TaxID=2614943 RepID=UPI000510100D|nr:MULTISPECIES: hypothetical protein [unclassified Sphingopyxis]KGB53803.1 hypothetical protein FG95_03219 [Sphingopyxis sp. LC363]MDT7527711.1 hypothetical protein [Sphingopyxis sp. SE2]